MNDIVLLFIAALLGGLTGGLLAFGIAVLMTRSVR
jgi:hypothetical protein